MTSTHEPEKEKVSLGGVSETALLTLNARAQAARPPDPTIDDPMAIALVQSIDYDFAKFGRARQDTALRARLFDTQTASYLAQHPAATVVALAPASSDQVDEWSVVHGGSFPRGAGQ